jgi:hypothetical protein
MAPPTDSDPPANPEPLKERWVEPVTAILMAMATLCTAWCSYESASWTRRSNRLMNDFSTFERRAGISTLKGMEMTTIHVAMFLHLLAAQHSGNKGLADFYLQRLPPDVRKSFDAWMAQKPYENPNAAPHPFVPELYEIRGSREAAELNGKAADSLRESRDAGNISGQFLANTVLFAAVLFFANAAGKFEQRRVRLTAFAFALAVFAFAVVRMLMLPL